MNQTTVKKKNPVRTRAKEDGTLISEGTNQETGLVGNGCKIIMTVKFISECPLCSLRRDHYQRLLEFVILVSRERHETDPFFKYVTELASDLLKDIGQL